MKSKAILVSFIALLAIVFALNTVVAMEFFDNTTMDVEVNGISVKLDSIGNAIGVSASESIPIVVKFTAKDSLEDVRIKTYIEGFKNEFEDETSRFHIIEGNTYVKRFTLKIPSTDDFDDDSLTEKLRLLIRFSAKGRDSVEFKVPLEIQKELHSLNLLSVDLVDVVVAGEKIALDVVVQNNGHDRLDNVYIKASISSLGVSGKIFAGDLESHQDNSDDDINDAVSKRIYLNIPRNAAPGNYEIEVEAYNFDTSTKTTGRVVIENVESGLLPTTASKTISPGQETSFDLVLVNPSNKMVIYTITPSETKGVLVEVSEPIAAVSGDSSKTVQVKVRTTENTPEGTYAVILNANTDSMTKQVSFTVNVEKPSKITGKPVLGEQPINMTVLTVVLVIVFVVLLIILIVLLAKRPTETEEIGETNYY